jgi:hypothetical protein
LAKKTTTLAHDVNTQQQQQQAASSKQRFSSVALH